MTQASKPLYSTQMLLVQKNTQHNCAVYFRELDKAIYEWVREEMPTDVRESFDKSFSVDDYLHATEKSFGFEENRILMSQNIETEKLLAHGICFRRYVRSNFDEMLKDAYIETNACLEVPKDGSEHGVHFSIAQCLVREPIRGFYPEKEILPTMPSLVDNLLSRPDTHAEFPRLPPDQEMGKDDFPDLRYPVDGDVEIVGKEAICDFMKRLFDPQRPVCMIVLFGKGRRIRRLANRFALKLFSKACVYHVPDLPPELAKIIEQVVEGMDVAKDIKDHVCRVFFPFGNYMRDSKTNPRFLLRLFRTDEIIQSVKRGCFACFEMEDIGWRKDDFDVYRTRKKLQLDRHKGKKMEEAIAEAEHEKRCGQIIAQKQAEIESLGIEKMVLEADLKEERGKTDAANAELAKAQARLNMYEQSTSSANGKSALTIPIDMSLYPDEVREHVLRAVKSFYDNADSKTMVRRRKILEKFLAMNPYKGELERRNNVIKRLFTKFKRPDEKFFRQLAELGIVKVSENEHYKISFADTPYTISKTPSESHGNGNAAAAINNLYF